MSELKCVTQTIHIDLKTGCDIKNITHEVNNVIKENKITIMTTTQEPEKLKLLLPVFKDKKFIKTM